MTTVIALTSGQVVLLVILAVCLLGVLVNAPRAVRQIRQNAKERDEFLNRNGR